MTSKHLAALAAIAALAAPTAAIADSSSAHGKSGAAHGHAGEHGKGQAKAKMAVFKGTIVSTDTTAGSIVVHVVKVNHWSKSFKDSDVTFTTTQDLTAMKAGDKVLVQSRIGKDSAQPFAAKKVIDQAADSRDATDSQDAPEAPEPPESD